VATDIGYGGLRQAPLEALLTAVAGPLVLALLRRLDGRLEIGRSRVGLRRGAKARSRSLGDGLGLR